MMGCVKTIDFDKFPEQGSWLGRRMRVCFHYDTERTLLGTVVRDDAGDPGVTIIKLDDGRHVLSTECMVQPI